MRREAPDTERLPGGAPTLRYFAARVALVAMCVVLALQLTRVFLVVVFNFGEVSGSTGGALKAGVLGLAISLSPLLAPAFPRFLGGRRGLVVALGSMGLARVGVQLVHPVPLWLATLGMAIGLAAVSLLLVALDGREGGGGRLFALGALTGLAVDTVLRTAFWTWDYAWQRGTGPVLLALLASAALVVLMPVAGSGLEARDQPSGMASWGAALVGPFLFLQIVFLQNMAFVSSSAHVVLPVAGAIVLLGDALAVAAVVAVDQIGVARSQPRARAAAAVAAAAAVMVVLAYLLRKVHGPGLTAIVLATQALAALFLVTALSSGAKSRSEQGGVGRRCVAFAAGSFALVLFVSLYQVVYRVKVPLPNTVLAPAAALILAFGALGFRQARHGSHASDPRVAVARSRTALLAGALLALVLVPVAVGLTRARVDTVAASGTSLRVMTYNVHTGGIDSQGQLNPEAIARVIEAQHPDVVALQEVVRGWPGPGGIDLAEWLSDRLRLAYAYAPAADDQFGNLILSRFPILSHRAVTLPRVSAVMYRSYLAATIGVGGRQSVTVIDAHLEGGRSDQDAQVQRLVDRWGHAPHTVIEGDMNMQPTNPNLARFTAAGLVSAQDQAGQGSQASATHPNFPGDRPDWIFGSPDLKFSGFGIGTVSPSDHRPLVVTVNLG